VDNQSKTPSRPGWSYFRISLRWLIALILLIGCWLGWTVNEARAQREAVAAIRDAGGGVWYDWQWDDGKTRYDGSPIWPKWLIDRLGIDYFGHVVAVIMYERASDEILVPIGRLRRLEYLDLSAQRGFASKARLRPPRPGEPGVTDAGLVHLEGLRRLEHLCLSSTAITDAGLVHVKGLTRLRRLLLPGTAINGPGLVFVRDKSRLEILNLDRTKIDDAALVHMENLTNLRMLFLGHNPHITGVGLDHIHRLTKLEDLDLDDTESIKPFRQQLKRALPGVTLHYAESE
jgi:internalin A